MAAYLLDTTVIIDVLNDKRNRRSMREKGKMPKLGDVTIAAVAIYEQLTLLTDNVKDFPMRELILYPMLR